MSILRRVLGCRLCHGTGVIMNQDCTCGSRDLYPHEALCQVDGPCPHGCLMAESQDRLAEDQRAAREAACQ